jgi:predicted ATPase/DNA-binding winged helix-turn-helix (wHTH) protein
VSAPDPSIVYANGRWEIDLSTRELRALGICVPIGGRAFDIIATLVRANGELVTKTELMALVWPNLAIGENALRVHVSALRRALGEDREILKTAPGDGYRLVGRWEVRAASPPLRSGQSPPTVDASSPRGNLPLSVSELIGRSSAVRDVRNRLSTYRTVTLVGPGGIGKSTLALHVARSLAANLQDGCWLVELASLTNPGLVTSAIARALMVQTDGGDVSCDAIARSIGGRALVIILDNCEHLIEAAAEIADVIMRLCPNASVLATSREPLRIEGECAYRVPALEVPPENIAEVREALEHSAVELFVDRMRASGFQPSLLRDDMAVISSICRRLDGIPLAIEFAAARAVSLGLGMVLAGLDHRFDLLKGGRRTAVPRHQALGAALDWSYELLSSDEQRQLRNLSVFAGGFTLEAAVAVTEGCDGLGVAQNLGQLVAKSLLTLDEFGGASRWRLLETIRAYAVEKCAQCGEAQEMSRLHAQFYRDLVAPQRTTSAVPPTSERIDLLSREIDNVRAALDWAFGSDGDTALGVILTAGYVPVWLRHSLLFECRDRAERALDSLESETRLEARLVAELELAICVALMHTTAVAKRIGVVLARALQVTATLDDIDLRLRSLWAMWSYRFNNGEHLTAKPFAEQFARLALQGGHSEDIFVANRIMGNTVHFLGQQAAARGCFESVLNLYVPPSGHRHPMLFNFDQRLLARTMFSRVIWLQGFLAQARNEADSTLEQAEAVVHERSLYMSYVLGHAICPIAIITGDLAVADKSVDLLSELAADRGATFWKARVPCLRGMLLIKRGEFAAGSTQLRAALNEVDRDQFIMKNPEYLGALAEGLGGLGRTDESIATIDAAVEEADREGCRWYLPELLRIKGELLLRSSREGCSHDLAEPYFVQALEEARRQGALLWELRAALSLSRSKMGEERFDKAREILAPVYGRFTEGFDAIDLGAARALLKELQ